MCAKPEFQKLVTVRLAPFPDTLSRQEMPNSVNMPLMYRVVESRGGCGTDALIAALQSALGGPVGKEPKVPVPGSEAVEMRQAFNPRLVWKGTAEDVVRFGMVNGAWQPPKHSHQERTRNTN